VGVGRGHRARAGRSMFGAGAGRSAREGTQPRCIVMVADFRVERRQLAFGDVVAGSRRGAGLFRLGAS
jgi:hypothetical protein